MREKMAQSQTYPSSTADILIFSARQTRMKLNLIIILCWGLKASTESEFIVFPFPPSTSHSALGTHVLRYVDKWMAANTANPQSTLNLKPLLWIQFKKSKILLDCSTLKPWDRNDLETVKHKTGIYSPLYLLSHSHSRSGTNMATNSNLIIIYSLGLIILRRLESRMMA